MFAPKNNNNTPISIFSTTILITELQGRIESDSLTPTEQTQLSNLNEVITDYLG